MKRLTGLFAWLKSFFASGCTLKQDSYTGGIHMPVEKPGKDEFKHIAEYYGFELSDRELDLFLALTENSLASYARLDQLDAPRLPVKYPRDGGRAPLKEENQYGAWGWRCNVKGAPTGKLAGKRVVLKDNISL